MTTKKTDDDNFFDDDLFDSDLFDEDDDSVVVQDSSRKPSQASEEDESLFDSLLSDQVDGPRTRNAPSVKVASSSSFEEDHTEVIMDEYEELPNTYLTDETGKVYNIRRSPFLVGRSSECDLVLNMKGVSRRHAELTFGGGHFVIRDLDSLNGTRVNGTPVPQIRLNDADVIQFGRKKFSFFTDSGRAARSRSAASRPLPPNRNSISLDDHYAAQRLEPVQETRQGSDWLIKLNFAVVAFIIVVTLSYVIWEDFSGSDDAEFAAQNLENSPESLSLPSLGDGEMLKLDEDDWTKTGKLPPAIDKDLEALAKAVEAQMKGEEPPAKSTSRTKSTQSEDEAAILKKEKAIKAERDSESSFEAESEAVEQQNIRETNEAKDLLNTIITAYLSGNQLTNSIDRMAVLSRSSVINNRVKRDLENTHAFYSGLKSRYEQGQKLFIDGKDDAAFEIWQELLVREKNVLSEGEVSYYGRQISERAVEMTVKKAQQAEADEDIGEAVRLYQKLAKLKPEGAYKSKIEQLLADAEERFAEAEEIMAKQPAQAVRLLQSVMDATPRNHPLHIRAEAKLTWLQEGAQ